MSSSWTGKCVGGCTVGEPVGCCQYGFLYKISNGRPRQEVMCIADTPGDIIALRQSGDTQSEIFRRLWRHGTEICWKMYSVECNIRDLIGTPDRPRALDDIESWGHEHLMSQLTTQLYKSVTLSPTSKLWSTGAAAGDTVTVSSVHLLSDKTFCLLFGPLVAAPVRSRTPPEGKSFAAEQWEWIVHKHSTAMLAARLWHLGNMLETVQMTVSDAADVDGAKRLIDACRADNPFARVKDARDAMTPPMCQLLGKLASSLKCLKPW